MDIPQPRALLDRMLKWLCEPALASRAVQSSRSPKPPGLMTHEDWVRYRAPLRLRDESLSDTAVRWLRRIREPARPLQLCVLFPRIANKLALLWRDPGLSEAYLDELIGRQRPGRKGFPTDVTDELFALQRLNDERLEQLEERERWFTGQAKPAFRN